MALMHVFFDPDGRVSAVIPKPGIVAADGPMYAGISPLGSPEGIVGYEIDLDPDLFQSPSSSSSARALRRTSVEDHIAALVKKNRDSLAPAALLTNTGLTL